MTGYAREHRDSLLVILSRVQRGVQSTAEAAVLRTHVEHLLTEMDEAEAAIGRARAFIGRLDDMAESTISVDDRSLYRALATDLRAALDEPKEPAP